MESVPRKELLRPSEVAELFGVSRNTVYRWLRREVFVAHRIGGCTFIRRADVRAHLGGESELYEGTLPELEEDEERDAQEMLLSFRGRRRT